MLLKTIRDSDATSQELHICAIFCSAKSIQLLHCVPMFERQVDINNVIGQYHQILKSLNEKESCSMPTLVEGVSVLSKILHNVDSLIELKTILASNGTIQLLLDLIRDCKLDKNGRKMLLPVVIDTLSLLLCDCPLANEKMIKSQGYEHLFNEVNGLGPPDSTILKAILAMATHGSQNDMVRCLKIQSRNSLNAVKKQSKYSQNLVSKCSQKQSKVSQNAVELQSKCSQNAV